MSDSGEKDQETYSSCVTKKSNERIPDFLSTKFKKMIIWQPFKLHRRPWKYVCKHGTQIYIYFVRG